MNATVITSRANSTFKELMRLQTAKGIWKSGTCLVGGEKLIHEIISGGKTQVKRFIGAPGIEPPDATGGIQHVILARELFNELNLLGTTGMLLEIATPPLPTFDCNLPWPRGCTLFVPFADPENVGAVARSAAGLGAARIVFLEEAACPFLPRAIRASAGAVLQVRIERGPAIRDLMRFLRDGPPVFALDARGASLDRMRWPAVFGLIAGMEGPGLPPEVLDAGGTLKIPLHNSIESLNAAASVAIALWDWRTKTALDTGSG